jgi:hypothetical protein
MTAYGWPRWIETNNRRRSHSTTIESRVLMQWWGWGDGQHFWQSLRPPLQPNNPKVCVSMQTLSQSSRECVVYRLQLREIITLPLKQDICTVHGSDSLLALRGTDLARAAASKDLPRIQCYARKTRAITTGWAGTKSMWVRAFAPGWRGGSAANSLCNTCLYLRRLNPIYLHPPCDLQRDWNPSPSSKSPHPSQCWMSFLQVKDGP